MTVEKPFDAPAILRVVAGFVLGGLVANGLVATVLCDVVHPGSNLCGLDSALFAGPLGSLAGAVAAVECDGAARVPRADP